MSNKNKWEALSMQDRAFLIRESVKNGITSLDDIRSTWEHRFDGETNNLTKEEYQALQARQTVEKALKESSENPIARRPIVRVRTKEELIELEHQLQFKQEQLKRLEKPTESNPFLVKINPAIVIPNRNNSDGINIGEKEAAVAKLKSEISDIKSCIADPNVMGDGCLYSSTYYYGNPVAGNQEFESNHWKYGFSKIKDEETKAGDIVQFYNNGVPVHAMIATTPYSSEWKNMRFNGTDGGEATRVNSRYPSSWDQVQTYRFEGSPRDSLRWGRDYIEKRRHQFSGEDNSKIQTDSEHKTDNSLIERIALNIGSRDSTKDEGRAGVRDIIMGTINALLGKQPTSNTNLAAFLGKPEDYGFKEINDSRGPQFHKRISQYEDQDIKTYKGIINPFNEYVVAQEDYDKFLELAKTGELFYGNADGDNTHSLYSIQDGRHSTISSSPLHSGYRDDVQNYPIQFYTKEGKLYANAADFYDFNTDSWQGKMLTKKGKPYILRQNDIPVRSIYVPEDLLNLNPIYNVEEGLTDDIRRARNMHITVQNRENNK